MTSRQPERTAADARPAACNAGRCAEPTAPAFRPEHSATGHHAGITTRRILAPLAVVVALLALADRASAQSPTAPPIPWSTAQATELTKQGKTHAASGDVEVAAKRFLDAITLDTTYGPAYLELGLLREKTGDASEAERAYSLGIERVQGFADGHVARGQLRKRQKRFAEALRDFELAAELRPDDAAILMLLLDAYVAKGAMPAALTVARRLESLALAAHDDAALSTARTRSHATAWLVADADPVWAGATERGAVRRALADLVRKRVETKRTVR